MASLKEVKTRINSVQGTRKITSAMKMVASSKLHRAQQSIESMRPYEQQLTHIMSTFVSEMEGELDSPYAVRREVKRVALILYTSNSSLCGGYNANAIKAFRQKVKDYRDQGIEIVKVYPFGRKGAEAVRKDGFAIPADYSALLDHPAFSPTAQVAAEIMDMYARKEIDEAVLIYHHFKSSASQVLTTDTFLPVTMDGFAESTATSEQSKDKTWALDFIIEPSKEEIVQRLIPRSLHLKLFTALLDSLAGEHAARVMAMQVATDNADDLLKDLTLTYNKTRQQAITNELLDIVAGSMQ